jgi:transposase
VSCRALRPGRLRAKISDLQDALTGQFTSHHAYLLAAMLARIDALTADITTLEAKISELAAGCTTQATIDRLDQIPGVGPLTALTVIAETGTDMTRFPTAGHLASWAKLTPIPRESAGKNKGRNATGDGNPYLAGALGEAAAAAGRTQTFLGDR